MLQGVSNGASGQGRGCCQHISTIGASATFKKIADKFPSKFLAPCRFRRLMPEKRGSQSLRDHCFYHRARARYFPVAVIGFAEALLRDRVYNHVARTSVEGEDLCRR